jgi:hypothetical protein
LQKNFQVREKIPLSALAFGCSHALVAAGLRSRRSHSSLISGLLGLEGSSKRKDSHCHSGRRGGPAPAQVKDPEGSRQFRGQQEAETVVDQCLSEVRAGCEKLLKPFDRVPIRAQL